MRIKRGAKGNYIIETASSNNSNIETAMFNTIGGISYGTGPSGASQTNAYLLGANVKDSMLEGIIATETPHELQAIYRDIYLRDHICGAAVDLKATMPWSSFTLSGCTNEQTEVFMSNIERLNMKDLHHLLSVDRMVSGCYVGILIYDKNLKGFTDIINLNIADIEVQPTPLFSQPPILHLNIPEEFKIFVNDKSPGAVLLQKRIPADILNAFRGSGKVELSPLGTFYIPRTSLSTLQAGLSLYARIVPMYLMERILYRGTISEITRRQRATLHIQAGSDVWIPRESELTELVGLFQSAEQDPISSVVATRNDVTTNEIRCIAGSQEVELCIDGNWKSIAIQDVVEHNPDEIMIDTYYTLDNVYAIGPVGNRSKVEAWIYRGISDVIKIIFNNEVDITCTNNHRLMVLNKDLSRDLATVLQIYEKTDGFNDYCWIFRRDDDAEVIPAEILNSLCDYYFDEDLYYEDYLQGEYSSLLDNIFSESETLYRNLVFLLNTRYEFIYIKSYEFIGKEHTYDLIMDISYAPVYGIHGVMVKNSGGDFFKWTDVIDQFATMKYKCLNINEGLLTADSTYNTTEAALNVFLEDIRSERDRITQAVYYDKLFPLISQLNNFVKDDIKETAATNKEMILGSNIQANLNDKSKFIIPEIHWHKPLKPEADVEYIEVLDTLSMHGVPIPLRMLAAAAGLSWEKLMEGLEQDRKDKEHIESVLGVTMEEGSIRSPIKQIPLLKRDFGELGEVYGETKTGKKKYIHNKRRADEKINRNIAKALKRINERII